MHMSIITGKFFTGNFLGVYFNGQKYDTESDSVYIYGQKCDIESESIYFNGQRYDIESSLPDKGKNVILICLHSKGFSFLQEGTAGKRN